MSTETATAPLTCEWCGGAVPLTAKLCPACFMPVEKASPKATEAPLPASGVQSEPEAKKPARKKSTAKKEVIQPLTMPELSRKIDAVRALGRRVAFGIDPGARYTAFSIRDDRGILYMSSTYYRDDDDTPIEWSHKCVDHVNEVLSYIDVDVLSLENVVDPTGFSGGKSAALNPKDIIRTGIIVGAIANEHRDRIVMVRPRKNGSVTDEGHYPKELEGRRPKDLPGFKDPRVTTRKHEKSAYDVAGTSLFNTRADEKKKK